MRHAIRRAGLFVMVFVIASRGTSAQERVTLQADALFYGDDTEFRNPFREGETILGRRARAPSRPSTIVNIAFGVVGNLR
jgi:hypothetical protein